MSRADIMDEASGRWRDVLLALGVESSYLTGKNTACPLCRAGRDRFKFDDKEGRGTWICSHCGAGNGIALVMKLRGLSFRDAASLVRPLLGSARAVKPKRERPDSAKRGDMARVWEAGARLTPGDAAWLYLSRRGLDPEAVGRSVRFVPDLDYYDEERREHRAYPGMVAMVQDAEGKPVNLHRTYLSADGAKANVPRPRRMMPGKVPDGAAIRLMEPWVVGGKLTLGIAEGIETALASYKLFAVPCWSSVDAVHLERWSPPAPVQAVVIFSDNDLSFTGQAAAFALARRVTTLKLDVAVCMPAPMGFDWNDVLMRGEDT